MAEGDCTTVVWAILVRYCGEVCFFEFGGNTLTKEQRKNILRECRIVVHGLHDAGRAGKYSLSSLLAKFLQEFIRFRNSFVDLLDGRCQQFSELTASTQEKTVGDLGGEFRRKRGAT